MRRRVVERMISASLVPTVKHGGGVIVWGCFVGDIVRDLFRIQDTLYQHGLRLVGQSFVFQQINDPKQTSRLYKGYLTMES